jgi:acylphosphatase
MSRAVRLMIRGRVQAVGYRAWTVDQAIRLGLRGWVRNRADGAVEAVAVGDAAAVQHLIDACRQGPSLARVSAVDVQPVDATEAGSAGFVQRPTA